MRWSIPCTSMSTSGRNWSRLWTDLDVLHAGRINPNIRVETAQIRALVDFSRRNYQALCFDLSGNLERYSLEIMQEAKRVLLVCTPEIASLHQAREKLHFLKALDLDSRVSVVLNRCQKKPLFTHKQVEELLGLSVIKMFPNDYHGVNRAMTAGTFRGNRSRTWANPSSNSLKNCSSGVPRLRGGKTQVSRVLRGSSAPVRLRPRNKSPHPGG